MPEIDGASSLQQSTYFCAAASKSH